MKAPANAPVHTEYWTKSTLETISVRNSMERTPVQSSDLVSVGYDSVGSVLEIEFAHNSVYQYFDVPAEEHAGLMNAPSHGKYFHKNIRDNGKYRYKKI